MKNTWKYALCVSLFLPLAAAHAADACQDALDKGQFSLAIQAAESMQAQPNAWLCKGRAQAALQDMAAAQTSFETALTLKPSGLHLISAYMLLGNAQHAQQQHLAAVTSYQQALALSEQQNMQRYAMIAHQLIGETHLSAGLYPEALAAFQAGEKLAMNDNERADSYAHQALAYHHLQQHDQAIAYQLKAVLMQQKAGTPDQYAEASLMLANFFVAQKDYVGADKTYQRLMQFAHDNGGSFYEAKTAIHWADAKRTQGDHATASQLLKQAERIAAQLQDAELNELLMQARQKE